MKRARDYVPVPGRDGRVVLVSTSIRISYKSIKKEQVSLDRRRFEEFWPQYAASSGSPDNITSRSPAGPSLTETVQTYLLVLRMTTVLKARAKIPVHEAAGDTPSLQPVSELTSRSSGAACVECGVETIPLCKHAAADSGPESSPVKTSHELKVGTGVQLAFLALRNCDISLGQRQGHSRPTSREAILVHFRCTRRSPSMILYPLPRSVQKVAARSTANRLKCALQNNPRLSWSRRGYICHCSVSNGLNASATLRMSVRLSAWPIYLVPLDSSSFAHDREFGIAWIRAPYILVIPKEDYLVLWPLYWAEPNCKVKVPVLNMASCPLYVPQSWYESRTSITARWSQFASVYINGLKTETHH